MRAGGQRPYLPCPHHTLPQIWNLKSFPPGNPPLCKLGGPGGGVFAVPAYPYPYPKYIRAGPGFHLPGMGPRFTTSPTSPLIYNSLSPTFHPQAAAPPVPPIRSGRFPSTAPIPCLSCWDVPLDAGAPAFRTHCMHAHNQGGVQYAPYRGWG